MTSIQAARPGRPRATGIAPESDVREDVLKAAAELFTSVGFARASTRAIADRVGVRQPTVFHYFPTKQALYEELLRRVTGPTVQRAERLELLNGSPQAKLYALIALDVVGMIGGEHHAGLLRALPETRHLVLEHFSQDTQRIRQAYARHIENARAAGAITCTDISVTTQITIGMVEGVALWYRAPMPQPDHLAQEIATRILGGLLTSRQDLKKCIAEGRKLSHLLTDLTPEP